MRITNRSGGEGTISSVNGDLGPDVVLDAADVNADPAGTGTTALNTAKTYAEGLVDDLSGVTNALAARTALGLGTSATQKIGAAKPYEGINLWSYGHSFAAVPGTWSSTFGSEYVRRLQQRYGFGQHENGVSGARMGDVATFLIGAKPITTPAYGLVLIEASANELYYDANTANANFQNGFKNSLRAMIAAAISNSRLESAVASVSGTWNTFADTTVSGGSFRQTTGNGNTLTWSSVSAPLGYVYLLTFVYDAGSTQGTLGVEVDNIDQSVSFTGLGGMKNYTGVNSAGVPTAKSFLPHVIKITVPSTGTHAIKIKKTDANTNAINVDALLIPTAVQPQVLVLKDPPGTGSFATSNGLTVTNTYTTYAPTYNSLIDSVVAEFNSNVKTLDLATGWDSSMNSANDISGVHPNDKGMKFIADALSTWIETNIPNPLASGLIAP
jgi:hypothetical protein